MGVSGQRHAPAAFYPWRKDPRYPLYRRLGGPQSRSGHRGWRKNPLPLPGIEPPSPGRPARSQTLYCLRFTALHGTFLYRPAARASSCGKTSCVPKLLWQFHSEQKVLTAYWFARNPSATSVSQLLGAVVVRAPADIQ
jgi:hypothetical protein